MSRNDESDAGHQRDKRQGSGRSIAEWTTLGISATIVLVFIGLVSYQYLAGGDRPPVVEVAPQLQSVRQVGDAYYLPVKITNEGDRTAEDVSVELSLTLEEGKEVSSRFHIGFLAGHETVWGTAVFREDPSGGEVTVDVVSFLRP